MQWNSARQRDREIGRQRASTREKERQRERRKRKRETKGQRKRRKDTDTQTPHQKHTDTLRRLSNDAVETVALHFSLSICLSFFLFDEFRRLSGDCQMTQSLCISVSLFVFLSFYLMNSGDCQEIVKWRSRSAFQSFCLSVFLSIWWIPEIVRRLSNDAVALKCSAFDKSRDRKDWNAERLLW